MSTPAPSDFEKLGAFYLGRAYDPVARSANGPPLLYDAKDLTTHAFCVGMTGSGKTGLCISLLEEAAIDGVPAICIDPKGDLGNLLLTFPSLAPEDFEPWIDPADAARRGQSPAERAASVASEWREGLASWGEDGARIARLREAAELAIYTPGSTAGTPLAIVRSLEPKPGADPEAQREAVDAAVSSLLALVGIDADPIQSREHVFLSNLLSHAMAEGRTLDLAGLVRAILEPPIARIGVLDLETVYPQKDRQALALRLNALLASPSFAAWMAGEPLDVQRLLYTASGKPRVVVLSIAHLSDGERMFFVTLLLGQVLSWMRTQPGTTSLRAILYMDEVFGFLPPVSEPPSKRLFLTLLKQARAFGLGLVLATQNPVDVDYKALSNCGTWFLGRLQTERDVDRVIDGLAGAAASAGKGFDAAAARTTLAGLEKRVFLMNDVHEDAPVLFMTRWTLSYLRGPLAKEQIRALSRPSVTTASASLPRATSSERPVVGEIEEVFVGEPSASAFVYQPSLLATVQLHYVHAKSGLDTWYERTLVAPLVDGTPAALWSGAEIAERVALRDAPLSPQGWLPVPRGALAPARQKKVLSALRAHVLKGMSMTLGHAAELGLYSSPGESYDAFVARVRQGAREARDFEVAKLRERWAKKLSKARSDVQRAEEQLAREKGQARSAQLDTALGVGTTVLGAIFGRGTISGHAGRAATAARKAQRASVAGTELERAEAKLAEAKQALASIEAEMQAEVRALQGAETIPAIEAVPVAPRKSDLDVTRFALAWIAVPPAS
jgi:hypothetical protein